MARNISFTLKFWRQNGPKAEGHFDTREMKDIPDDTSFLEMLDILNEELIEEGEAKRDDENFFYVGCWEYQGSDDKAPELTKEPLEYEAIKVQTRNYKN